MQLLADEVANMLKNLYCIGNEERLFCAFCEVRLHNDNLNFCFVVLCILKINDIDGRATLCIHCS